jgi:DNA mismatch repair endonuclease MutH
MGDRYPYRPFDYRTATSHEIQVRAREMVGKTLGEIAARPAIRIVSAAETKGFVGAAVERFFGIAPNPISDADFPSAHIELKIVPLRRRGPGDYVVKERTYISMIDYHRLAEEAWESASIRKKLSAILFVFYEWRAEVDMHEFPVLGIALWSPTQEVWQFLAADWDTVRDKVLGGVAHLISESDGRILGAATKGATGAVRRTQPFSKELARQRGWALKPPFTRSVYLEAMRPRKTESLVDNLAVDRPLAFEAHVLDHVRRFVGRTVGDVAKELGVPPSSAKNWAATVVRRALGVRDSRARILEFERLGIRIHTVPVNRDARPHEHTSFPAFQHEALAAEEWEDSELFGDLNRILFVPLLREAKGSPYADAVLQRPFFWSPTADQLSGIRREWEMFRDHIAGAQADRLPPASQTRYIHVRPKAALGSDTETAPGGLTVTKKAFWLNQRFVQELILAQRWEATTRR